MLTTLKCSCFASDKYIFQDVSSLVKADVYMSLRENKEPLTSFEIEEFGGNMGKLLEGLSNAKTQTLSCCCSEVFKEVKELQPVPSLNIKQLSFAIWQYKDSIPGMKYLLRNSHHLQTLRLNLNKVFAPPTKRGEYEGANSLLECNFDHLKLIEFEDFLGYEIEYAFLKVLLKRASTLEKLHLTRVYYYLPFSKSKKKKCRWKINALPRASSNV